MDKKLINLLLIIVILILLAINIKIYINNNKDEESNSMQNIYVENNVQNIQEEKDINNTITNKVSEMTERSRMQSYFGTFIKYIEKKEYESAYNLLNESFKNNYFTTLEEFENYVQKYPKNIVVDYKNIDRQGELYVLEVEIKDVFDSTIEPITQRVVVRELGANEFTLSFQVE